MSDEHASEEGTPRSRSAMAVWIALLPIFYALSVGPLGIAYDNYRLEGTVLGKALEVIFAPLKWLHQWSDGGIIQHMLDKWLQFWSSLI